MSKKAVKGVALAGIVALGTGAIFKASKYLKEKQANRELDHEIELEAEESNSDSEQEEMVNNERSKTLTTNLLRSLEDITGVVYSIGIPDETSVVDLSITELLRNLCVIDKNESVLVD